MISKETFITYINYCEHLNDLGKIFNQTIATISNNDGYAYIYDEVIAKIGDLLREALGVEDKSDWVGYYMWELDFGKGYEPGIINSKDGEDISLSNASELYDILMEEKNV